MPPIHVLPHAARKHVPSPKPERAACPLRAPLPHHASSRPCADYEPRCARARPRAARGAVAGPWLGCGSALHALRAGGCDDSPYQYEATRFDLDSPYQYEATAAHEAARSPWQQQRAHYEEAYLARSMRSLTSAYTYAHALYICVASRPPPSHHETLAALATRKTPTTTPRLPIS